ncbi:MAG: hypothetical protein IJH77_01510, partial [Mogibacterium sp.]|nr:hypothetical protein [Mogibacterium sp.]
MEHLLKNAIAKKGYAAGTFLGTATPAIMEGISYTGLDFVIIDTEHGPYDTMPMSDLIMTAVSHGVSPIVRVADVTHKEIQRVVDNGAEGIIIPCLRELEDFRKVVEFGKFPPLGKRGFMWGRGSGFGNEPWASQGIESYMQNSNDKVLLLPQCETVEALDQIEEIVQIDGIDGIFIGPYDLSVCMGIPGQFDKTEFREAVQRILRACKDAGKLCVMFTMDPA